MAINCIGKDGKAKVDYSKDINIVKSPGNKLLVVLVQNRNQKFQTPPTWDGLQRLGQVMNNLVQTTTQHHTLSGSSYACGARRHFGSNNGCTVTLYATNPRSKKMKKEVVKDCQMPTVESIERASEILKNILGPRFWQAFKKPQDFAMKATATKDKKKLYRGSGWVNFVANKGISTCKHKDKDANYTILVRRSIFYNSSTSFANRVWMNR